MSQPQKETLIPIRHRLSQVVAYSRVAARLSQEPKYTNLTEQEQQMLLEVAELHDKATELLHKFNSALLVQ